MDVGTARHLAYSNKYKDVKLITYIGHIPSLNDLYGSKHWRARFKAANAYHLVFKELFKKVKLKKFKNKFSLFVVFNSRHDTDNIVGIEKYFTDTLVKEGYVGGDNKNFYRGLLIVPDEKLKKNTVEFYIAIHKDDNN